MDNITNSKTLQGGVIPAKVYIGDNLITDSEDWNRVIKRFSEYEMKAKAFDLLADHIELIPLLTSNVFKQIQMTKSEIETVANALGVKIDWVEIKNDTDTAERVKKKRKYWSE